MPVMPDYPDTQESDNINIHAREKDGDHVRVVDRKRKQTCFIEEEVTVFNNMTHEVKEVAIAIGESKTVDAHPELYDAVMEQGDFSLEALMGKWYALFEGRVSGVYNSWEVCNQQSLGYNDSNHRGFKTRQAADDAYFKYVQEQACIKVEIAKACIKVEIAKNQLQHIVLLPQVKMVLGGVVYTVVPFYKRVRQLEDKAIENVETALDVFERASEVTEKFGANVANSLPKDGSLHKLAEELEYIAEEVDKDAHKAEVMIKKDKGYDGVRIRVVWMFALWDGKNMCLCSSRGQGCLLKGNIDRDPDELDMVFDLCPSYGELLEQVRKDLNWMDPSDVVEFDGRHNVGFRMHIRWKTMRVNSDKRWLAYKDTVAESLDKALELFAIKTNVPNLQLDLNRVASPIVEAIPAPMNKEANIEPLSCVEHEPLLEANDEHDDD
ncbi:hypothetical protein D1007_08921 [Hordeum vulgare]|nr:hypothetical protein D1007_08921 [Hordeum vulgare]